MTKRLLLAGLLFCFSFFGSLLPLLAQADRDAGDDPLVKLKRAGWTIIQDGVLQRQATAGEVETFVFGVEGFTWKLRDLGGQLAFLQKEFKAHPTPELRQAIASHRKAIVSTLETLERARAAEASSEAILPKTDCTTISFPHKVHASYKTDQQGAWADATAIFSVAPGCDISGEVYAYAFAKTTVNGAPTTITVTDGPRTGSDVRASAAADRNGGEPCESFGFASVTSNALNPSSYSKSLSNESCPVPQEGYSCPICTTYADGSQCCVSCYCDGTGMTVACTQNYCPPPGEEGGLGRD